MDGASILPTPFFDFGLYFGPIKMNAGAILICSQPLPLLLPLSLALLSLSLALSLLVKNAILILIVHPIISNCIQCTHQISSLSFIY